MLDLGNQIGGGDIDEVAGGEGKEKRHIEAERRAVRDETAGQESQRRKKVVEQCFAYFPTAMDEDAEVSQFLRHFMGAAAASQELMPTLTSMRNALGAASFSAADGASALIAFASARVSVKAAAALVSLNQAATTHFRRIADCYLCVLKLKFIEVVRGIGNVIAAQAESKVFIFMARFAQAIAGLPEMTFLNFRS